MARTISQDLRERVVSYVEAGNSRRSAARHFDVSVSFVVKLMQQWQSVGHVRPRYRGRVSGSSKLAPYETVLRDYIAHEPDVTLHEMAEQLGQEYGVRVDPSTIHRYLLSIGLTYKKNSGRV